MTGTMPQENSTRSYRCSARKSGVSQMIPVINQREVVVGSGWQSMVQSGPPSQHECETGSLGYVTGRNSQLSHGKRGVAFRFNLEDPPEVSFWRNLNNRPYTLTAYKQQETLNTNTNTMQCLTHLVGFAERQENYNVIGGVSVI
jgi:hypothetical protein